MEYRGTKNYFEPSDIDNISEVAYFSPSWYNDGVIHQVVSVASITDKNEISIIMSKMYDGGFAPSFCHMVFTRDEVEIILKAIESAKEKWIR
jgi:hypothetical protein